MNILLIMDPGIPVPPLKYGGIERIVYLLANAYVEQGHQVTLLAGPASHCNGKTVTFGTNKLNGATWSRIKAIAFVWAFLIRSNLGPILTGKTVQRPSPAFALIHNFGRLAYLLPVFRSSSTKIMSYQRKITPKNINILQRFRPKNMWFTACSANCKNQSGIGQADAFRGASKTYRPQRLAQWKTIYNTVDFSAFELNTVLDDDAPLMFLGRLDSIKGAHTAIEVAKSSHSKLWIAGNIPQSQAGRTYFKDSLAPEIDGSQIIYLGELDDQQKSNYLSRSKALLFPIEWEEPFGIVMIEAMACGTPVIAFNKGSVPEVVTPGKTGFIVEDASAMVKAIPRLRTLNRRLCRDTSMAQFDISVIAGKYLALAGTRA
mgnify:CR=1 FL=1